MFEFRRATVFLFWTPLLQAQNDYAKNFGGHASPDPPGCAYETCMVLWNAGATVLHWMHERTVKTTSADAVLVDSSDDDDEAPKWELVALVFPQVDGRWREMYGNKTASPGLAECEPFVFSFKNIHMVNGEKFK